MNVSFEALERLSEIQSELRTMVMAEPQLESVIVRASADPVRNYVHIEDRNYWYEVKDGMASEPHEIWS
jgi:hypothetical protein